MLVKTLTKAYFKYVNFTHTNFTWVLVRYTSLGLVYHTATTHSNIHLCVQREKSIWFTLHGKFCQCSVQLSQVWAAQVCGRPCSLAECQNTWPNGFCSVHGLIFYLVMNTCHKMFVETNRIKQEWYSCCLPRIIPQYLFMWLAKNIKYHNIQALGQIYLLLTPSTQQTTAEATIWSSYFKYFTKYRVCLDF